MALIMSNLAQKVLGLLNTVVLLILRILGYGSLPSPVARRCSGIRVQILAFIS